MRIKNYIIENYIILIFWGIVTFVMWLQIIPQTESLIEATLYPVLAMLSVFPFVKYLSETLLQRAMKQKTTVVFILQFLGISIITGIIFTLYQYFFTFLEKEGVFPLSIYFNMDDLPNFYILIFLSSGILINLCICGLRFFQENTKLKRTLIEYQLRSLQHQVTPHFMFNVLNHIHILMQTNVELASNLLIKYSEILRYQLYNGDKQITLEQDIQFLKDFIAVEEFRWEGKLTVTCLWKLESPQKEIPSLLFITFIENAFKHVSKSDFEKGYINIDFEQKENTVSLNVENSKSTLSTKKKNVGGLGLKNIKQRLEILYFGKYNLSVKETEATYHTKIIINI